MEAKTKSKTSLEKMTKPKPRGQTKTKTKTKTKSKSRGKSKSSRPRGRPRKSLNPAEEQERIHQHVKAVVKNVPRNEIAAQLRNEARKIQMVQVLADAVKKQDGISKIYIPFVTVMMLAITGLLVYILISVAGEDEETNQTTPSPSTPTPTPTPTPSVPTEEPSQPTPAPTSPPTEEPTEEPTQEPTEEPTTPPAEGPSPSTPTPSPGCCDSSAPAGDSKEPESPVYKMARSSFCYIFVGVMLVAATGISFMDFRLSGKVAMLGVVFAALAIGGFAGRIVNIRDASVVASMGTTAACCLLILMMSNMKLPSLPGTAALRWIVGLFSYIPFIGRFFHIAESFMVSGNVILRIWLTLLTLLVGGMFCAHVAVTRIFGRVFSYVIFSLMAFITLVTTVVKTVADTGMKLAEKALNEGKGWFEWVKDRFKWVKDGFEWGAAAVTSLGGLFSTDFLSRLGRGLRGGGGDDTDGGNDGYEDLDLDNSIFDDEEMGDGEKGFDQDQDVIGDGDTNRVDQDVIDRVDNNLRGAAERPLDRPRAPPNLQVHVDRVANNLRGAANQPLDPPRAPPNLQVQGGQAGEERQANALIRNYERQREAALQRIHRHNRLLANDRRVPNEDLDAAFRAFQGRARGIKQHEIEHGGRNKALAERADRVQGLYNEVMRQVGRGMERVQNNLGVGRGRGDILRWFENGARRIARDMGLNVEGGQIGALLEHADDALNNAESLLGVEKELLNLAIHYVAQNRDQEGILEIQELVIELNVLHELAHQPHRGRWMGDRILRYRQRLEQSANNENLPVNVRGRIGQILDVNTQYLAQLGSASGAVELALAGNLEEAQRALTRDVVPQDVLELDRLLALRNNAVPHWLNGRLEIPRNLRIADIFHAPEELPGEVARAVAEDVAARVIAEGVQEMVRANLELGEGIREARQNLVRDAVERAREFEARRNLVGDFPRRAEGVIGTGGVEGGRDITLQLEETVRRAEGGIGREGAEAALAGVIAKAFGAFIQPRNLLHAFSFVALGMGAYSQGLGFTPDFHGAPKLIVVEEFHNFAPIAGVITGFWDTLEAGRDVFDLEGGGGVSGVDAFTDHLAKEFGQVSTVLKLGDPNALDFIQSGQAVFTKDGKFLVALDETGQVMMNSKIHRSLKMLTPDHQWTPESLREMFRERLGDAVEVRAVPVEGMDLTRMTEVGGKLATNMLVNFALGEVVQTSVRQGLIDRETAVGINMIMASGVIGIATGGVGFGASLAGGAYSVFQSYQEGQWWRENADKLVQKGDVLDLVKRLYLVGADAIKEGERPDPRRFDSVSLERELDEETLEILTGVAESVSNILAISGGVGGRRNIWYKQEALEESVAALEGMFGALRFRPDGGPTSRSGVWRTANEMEVTEKDILAGLRRTAEETRAMREAIEANQETRDVLTRGRDFFEDFIDGVTFGWTGNMEERAQEMLGEATMRLREGRGSALRLGTEMGTEMGSEMETQKTEMKKAVREWVGREWDTIRKTIRKVAQKAADGEDVSLRYIEYLEQVERALEEDLVHFGQNELANLRVLKGKISNVIKTAKEANRM